MSSGISNLTCVVQKINENEDNSGVAVGGIMRREDWWSNEGPTEKGRIEEQ